MKRAPMRSGDYAVAARRGRARCRSVTGGPSGSWWTFANTASWAGLIGRLRWTRRSSRPSCAPSVDRTSTRKAPRARSGFPSATSRRFPSCVRLFTPPGGVARMVRGRDGRWRLEQPAVGEVDDRWVVPGPALAAFSPRKNAVKQAQVVEALRGGELRVAELAAQFGAVSSVLKALEAKDVVRVVRRRRMRGVQGAASEPVTDCNRQHVPSAKPALTAGQAAALSAIERACDAGCGRVVLVDGVTGSGKTEVYLQAIERVLAQGRTACVLVPEISLTPQTVGRFRGRFGDTVAVMHSRMSAGERFDQWDFIRSGAARVVVGARSALFTPLANIGLIVIDEEHEGTLQARQRAALPCARRGRVDGPSQRGGRGARQRHAFHRVAVPVREKPAVGAGDFARARQRPAYARGARGGHGARVRRRVALHVLGGACARAAGRAFGRAQSGAAAQPARVREVSAVPRMRVRAEVPALRNIADLPRARQLPYLPPLRVPPGHAAGVPEVQKPLPEKVRRGNAARGRRAARGA